LVAGSLVAQTFKFIAEKGGETKMSIMDQLLAVVIFGIAVVALPYILNKWSDSRAGVR
jgi:hypothetical protein